MTPEFLYYNSPHDPDKDPDDSERRRKRILKRLSYASGVTVTVDGEAQDSAKLLASGDFQPVVDDLVGRKRAEDGDVENNLGCAYAWAREWTKARAHLNASKTANPDSDRADKNLQVVQEASKA